MESWNELRRQRDALAEALRDCVARLRLLGGNRRDEAAIGKGLAALTRAEESA